MTADTRTILLSLLALAIAGVTCFAVSPLIKRFASVVGAIDVPKDDRRMHTVPIPRLGGLAIFIGFLASVLLVVDIDRQIQGILLGAVVIVIMGVLDDIYRLPAWPRLLVQIGAAILPISHGVVAETLSNPFFFLNQDYFDLGILSIPFTIVWIVGITNAVNWIDGLDGLALGVSAIASFSLLVIALLLALPVPHTLLLAALTGACLGFFPYNLNPAKMFMGDTGAMFLGFLLATTSIQGLFKFYAVISFAVPFLILGLPIFDTMSSIIRRVSKGKSPASADRGHVHHRLIDMGFSQKQSVAILYTMSAILGLSAVLLTASGEIKALLLILAVIAASFIGFRVYKSVSGGGNGRAEETPPAEVASSLGSLSATEDPSPAGEDVPAGEDASGARAFPDVDDVRGDVDTSGPGDGA